MTNTNRKKRIKFSTNSIELRDSTNVSFAKICPEQGGCLQELILDNNTIIESVDPSIFDEYFASAILFPFTGRVKNNTYSFDDKKYKLELNLKEGGNALHGLVYNKPFEIIENKLTKAATHLKLKYSEVNKNQGFPFIYSIELHYTLSKDELKLDVTIENTDCNSFPYSIGWHPYFYTKDLYNSYLTLDSNKKISFDDKMIPIEILDVKTEDNLQIKDTEFDDCYILNNNKVCFKTPDYSVEISSSSQENYLQIFTPKKPNSIAIEPMTGLSNSFNNKLGLQVLKPSEIGTVSWGIKLKK